MEVIQKTAACSNIALTMLTDTTLMGWCSMAVPVNITADPGEVSVSVLGKTVNVDTEAADEAHTIYLFGGYGAYEPDPPAFILESIDNNPARHDAIHW